jgi:hypothetical protein
MDKNKCPKKKFKKTFPKDFEDLPFICSEQKMTKK